MLLQIKLQSRTVVPAPAAAAAAAAQNNQPTRLCGHPENKGPKKTGGTLSPKAKARVGSELVKTQQRGKTTEELNRQ